MRLVLSLIALLCAPDVTACSLAPSAYDLNAFLAESKNSAVVFTGRVDSVTPSDDGKLQSITIEADRWWMGRPRERVVVIGSSGTARGTSCEGVFDFHPPVGSTMLIVGKERSGEIHPMSLLSREENIAKLPQALKQVR